MKFGNVTVHAFLRVRHVNESLTLAFMNETEVTIRVYEYKIERNVNLRIDRVGKKYSQTYFSFKTS